MTTATVPLVAAPSERAGKWRARVVEFLVVGGVTLVLFPVAWLSRRAVGLDTSELAAGFLTFHAAHVINDPHFAVTYLLFYKDARNRALGDAFRPMQRLRYVVAGFVVPLLLAAWAIVALTTGSARTMGWMVELMFLLVGWHYAMQGFGVLAVLSSRAGIRFSPVERRAILGHAYAGWAYAWASPAHPSKVVEEKGVVYTALAHPPLLDRVTQIVFFVSAAALIWILVRKRQREGRWPPLAALAGFLISIWLWMVYSWADRVMLYLIPALHSVQYLYFVWLLRRNEARAHESPPTFGPPPRAKLAILALSAVALGWILLRAGPALLDGALVSRRARLLDMGPTPYVAALFVFVNIHHYFMDHVIWRRDNPETAYMLR